MAPDKTAGDAAARDGKFRSAAVVISILKLPCITIVRISVCRQAQHIFYGINDLFDRVVSHLIPQPAQGLDVVIDYDLAANGTPKRYRSAGRKVTVEFGHKPIPAAPGSFGYGISVGLKLRCTEADGHAGRPGKRTYKKSSRCNQE